MMRWIRHHFEQQETIVTLLCKKACIEKGEQALLSCRRELEKYIQTDPEFAMSHEPYSPNADAPQLVKNMSREATKVNVGPMATVAGTFAQECLAAMLVAGAEEAVVDNGGDIALSIRKPIHIGIYAGTQSVQELAFKVEPREEYFGICTSSESVGHSFSYGKADAAVVISPNILLADAAATALGNRVQDESDLKSCFEFLEDLEEIDGALVVYQDKISLWGNLPQIVRSKVPYDLITKGKEK